MRGGGKGGSVHRQPGVPHSAGKDTSDGCPIPCAPCKPTAGQKSKSATRKLAFDIAIDAYKCRNVYKSIVRHISSYVREKKEEAMAMLRTRGFGENEIANAFLCISQLRELDKAKGVAKRQQDSINFMVRKKTIYTFILKETLQELMEGWETGKRGRIMEDNVQVYMAVCKEYHRRCCEILSQPF